MGDPRIDVLIEAERIQARIAELGAQIRSDYGPDEAIICIGVLKGSVPFLADLIRRIEGPLICEFLGVSSYRGTKSTGTVRITHDLAPDISGRHCLLVEDIVDTGLTLSYLLELLGTRQPASVKVCTLLDKPARRKVEMRPDYVGFEISDHFVVGFGLDFNQLYRNIPYIGVYNP